MKKYILTVGNHVYKRGVKNSNNELFAASRGKMISLNNGDNYIAPVCFKKHFKHCSRCAFDANFFDITIKKETNSIIVCLFWRIFYRRITWNSKK